MTTQSPDRGPSSASGHESESGHGPASISGRAVGAVEAVREEPPPGPGRAASIHITVQIGERPSQSLTLQLWEARYKQGLTMQQVAERMGNYKSNVCTWEAGTHAPNADHLVRWAKALGFRVVLVPEDQP